MDEELIFAAWDERLARSFAAIYVYILLCDGFRPQTMIVVDGEYNNQHQKDGRINNQHQKQRNLRGR